MEKIILRKITPTDSVKNFSPGSEEFTPLKTFLIKKAVGFHNKNLAKTYVITQEANNKVLAYITLTNSEIALEDKDKPQDWKKAKTYHYFPAIKIARLAVDSSIRGSGLGKALLNYTIILAKDRIMPYVGCCYLVVDSKKNAISFYESTGFKLIDTDKNKSILTPLMFLDLNAI